MEETVIRKILSNSYKVVANDKTPVADHCQITTFRAATIELEPKVTQKLDLYERGAGATQTFLFNGDPAI